MKKLSNSTTMLVSALAVGLAFVTMFAACDLDIPGMSGTGGGGTTVPGTPTGVTATRSTTTATTVTVRWSAVSGATSYRVYYSSTGSDAGTRIASPTGTSTTSSSRSTIETHYFRVSAVNSAGESAPSSWVSVGQVAPAFPPPEDVVPFYYSFYDSYGNTVVRVNVTWNAVSGATDYRIYHSITGSGSGTRVGTLRNSNSTQPEIYLSTRFNTDETNYFSVCAVNTYGEEGLRSLWALLPPLSTDPTPPSGPSGPSANVTATVGTQW